jgi:phosphate transport system substrate-binding protein
MVVFRAAILAALFVMSLTGRGGAEDVTLTSRDGSVEISGNILGYDGEFYRVDTVYGVLTIDGSGVICDGPGCPDLESFVAEFDLSGSRTMGEVLLPALVEAFAVRNGFETARNVTSATDFSYVLSDTASGRVAARIGFRVTSTSEGFADLLANETDLVLATRLPSQQEVDLVVDAGLGNLSDPRRARIVALDALVPIVSKNNPLRTITMAELAGLFAGEIANWADLGVADSSISLHLRDELSGYPSEFIARVLAPEGLALAGGVVRHASNGELADAVARNPMAIGIAAFSDTGNAVPLEIRGTCGIRAIARPDTIKTEDYPLSVPLFIFSPQRRLPILLREFLAFTRSPDAQPIIARAGFVDLSLQAVPVEMQGTRLLNAISATEDEIGKIELKRMTTRMDGTSRLSLNFRFQLGGASLDAQSLSSVDILARQLEQGLFDERQLIFVGFSDGDGAADANLRLARQRAEVVRRAVLNAATTVDPSKLRLSVDAFGEAMPMACDDSDWGRRINRRVEVWVGQR